MHRSAHSCISFFSLFLPTFSHHSIDSIKLYTYLLRKAVTGLPNFHHSLTIPFLRLPSLSYA
ncbi:hypothetical protein BJ165DRAFT_1513686 [Panaeolus papilionaceus]|nr:hypothetical protein BJ165DRAFT_1513686 [Panaeolus papilionaceus]